VKNGLDIVPVARMDEVIKHALVRQPEPIEWDEAKAPAVPAVAEEEAAAALTAH
jgi:ATP-dependent Lon protease